MQARLDTHPRPTQATSILSQHALKAGTMLARRRQPPEFSGVHQLPPQTLLKPPSLPRGPLQGPVPAQAQQQSLASTDSTDKPRRVKRRRAHIAPQPQANAQQLPAEPASLQQASPHDTEPLPLEYALLCPQQWSARAALFMAQLTGAVRDLMWPQQQGGGHTFITGGSNTTGKGCAMRSGFAVGSGFVGSGSRKSSGTAGFLGLSSSHHAHNGQQGSENEEARTDESSSPLLLRSITSTARRNACHQPLSSCPYFRMLDGIAPIPHTLPPALPPSSDETTQPLRRNEVVPPWAASSSSTDAQPHDTTQAEVAISGGTLHPVLGTASNHAVGFWPVWGGVEAAVRGGRQRVRALLMQQSRPQQQECVQQEGQQQQEEQGAGAKRKRRHERAKSKHTEREESEGEEEREEDWHWWQNLRFTLCMLRRGLSKSGLARGALVVYIASPSSEAYDITRCCLEAAACLTPQPAPDQSQPLAHTQPVSETATVTVQSVLSETARSEAVIAVAVDAAVQAVNSMWATGAVPSASCVGPSFVVPDTSLPASQIVVQVLLPETLHDPTSSGTHATAVAVKRRVL